MKTKVLSLALLIALVFAGASLSQESKGYYYHEVQVLNDEGRPVTDINLVYIYLPGTTTNQTIYADRNLQQAITLPMTIASTNTTLSNGVFKWWGADQYDFMIGNDDVTAANAHTQAFNRSSGTIHFPYYLQTVATVAWTDAQSITLGTGSDWVINGGAVTDRLTLLPATNGATMIIGDATHLVTQTLWGTPLISGNATQTIVIEGTANDYEATLQFTDPTADVTYVFPVAATASYSVMLSTLATNAPDIANSVTGGTNELIFEGANVDAHEIHVTAGEAAGDVIYSLPIAAAGTYGFVTSTLAANGIDTATSVTMGTNEILFEGTNVDAHEIHLTAGEAAGDVIYSLPIAAAGTYGFVTSTLAANGLDTANSVSAGSSTLTFEGSGVDGYEHVITATNPTADIIWTLPDATAQTVSFMSSTLATNMPQIANSVWGGTSQLIFEGSGLDTYEHTITATNPTADIVWTLPDAGAMTVSFMTSSLATNMPQVANSVWGGTDLIVFEGATADGSELSLAPHEPNADCTLTLLDYTGGIPVVILQSADDECAIDDVTAVDVNGTSIAFADEWVEAGTTVEWTLAGTKTGANGTLMVYLYLDDGIQCTLTSKGNTAGDWHAVIQMHEYGAYATQVITGTFVGADGEATDIDTDTTNFDDGSATTVKCQLDLSNGSDSATCDFVCVKAWKK